jgi:hypothetical protein
MQRKIWGTIGLGSLSLVVALVALGAAGRARTQDAKTAYPNMAPIEQYLMERNAEIALARSAAPDAISKDAEVMVLGRHGFETAVKGTNGFVCMVQRGWSAGPEDPNFWNPKLRGAMCWNAAAARYNLPITNKRTLSVMAAQSKTKMLEDLKVAFDKKEIPALEMGAMCYMLSKDSNLGDGNGHWRPHLMFYVPETDAKAWGADVPGSPVISAPDPGDRMMLFLVPVGKWSDGTVYSAEAH